MKKSIVIIGKGPSVQRCTKEFIDSFNEVAICNRPLFDGYEHLISNRAHYDFITNDIHQRKYTEEFKEKLGIIETIYTGDESILRKNFEFKELDPSTGTLALQYFIDSGDYSHIALVGFDLFEVDKKVYYFNLKEVIKPLIYLFENGTYDKDLKILKASGHSTPLTYEYMCHTFKKNRDIKFTLITNYPFEAGSNVEVR